MGMMDWVVGFGISYEDDGAADKVKALATTARDANKAFIDLQKSADKLAASIGKVSVAAYNADKSVARLADSFAAAASAGSAAGVGADAASAGFKRAASAAREATRSAREWSATVGSMPALTGGALGSQLALGAGLGGSAILALGSGQTPGSALALRGPSTLAGIGGGGGGSWIPGGPLALAGGGQLMLTGGGALVERMYQARPIPRRVFPWSRPANELWNAPWLTNGLDAVEGALPGMASYAWSKGKKLAKQGAVVGSGLSYDALYEAGKLQQELTGIQVGTGANPAQMDRIRQAAYDISNMTAQSVAQSAGVIGVMASSGINDPKALLARDPKTGQSFAEIVAKYADVQFLKSHGSVSFEEATKQAIQLAHLHGNYKPEEIAPMLDTVSKLSFMMPDTMSKYVTQAGYYTPILKKLGVPEDQTLILGAFLDRMGLGRGKGGTAVQNFVQAMMKPLSLTGHHQAGQIAALESLGIYSGGRENAAIFKTDPRTGHSVIDVFGALQSINKSIDEQTKNLKGDAKARKERELIGDFQKAFGIQGQRFGLLGDDKGIQMLLDMIGQIKRMPSVDQMQHRYMTNMDSQAARAWSNFQSLMTELGTLAIPGVTKGLTDLGDAFHNAQAWLHQHGDLEKKIQKGIYDNVVGLEKYIVEHKQDWKDLAHYMGAAGKDAKDLAGAIAGLFGPFMYALRYGKILMKGTYSENGLSQSDFDALDPEGAHYRLAQEHIRRDIRVAGTKLPPPRQPGPTIVNLHQGAIQINGTNMTEDQLVSVMDRTFKKMVGNNGDQRSRAGRVGSISTSPHQPTVLSTPQFHR